MKVDMSSKAITVRLRRVSQLRRLCLELAKARPVPNPAVSLTPQEQAEPSSSEPAEGIPDQAQDHDR